MIPQTGKVFLKFGATWCAPCKMLKQALTGVTLPVEMIEIDVDDHPDLAQQFNVRGVPTMVLLEDGKEIRRKVGSATATQVLGFIEQG